VDSSPKILLSEQVQLPTIQHQALDYTLALFPCLLLRSSDNKEPAVAEISQRSRTLLYYSSLISFSEV